MGWKIWQKSGPRPLTSELKQEVVQKFRISDEDAGRLCFVSKKGTFSGRPAQRVRVYDRDLLKQEESRLKDHAHMDGECQAILFEGHIESSGRVFLIDHRPAAQAQNS